MPPKYAETFIHTDYYPEDLITPPEYAYLNSQFGIPETSTVLQPIVDRYDGDLGRVQDKLREINRRCPILLMSPYLRRHLPDLMDQMDILQPLYKKIRDITVILNPKDLDETYVQLLFQTIDVEEAHRFDEGDDYVDSTDQIVNALLAFYEANGALSLYELNQILSFAKRCCKKTQFQAFTERLMDGESDLDKIASDLKIQPVRFDSVSLKILDGCTIQCRFCCNSEPARQSKWQCMTMEQIDELAPILKESFQMHISGGEPFDHPQIIELLKHLTEVCQAPIDVCTTGAEIDQLEALLPLLQSQQISFTLSISNQYGAKGKRRGAQTIAFLIRHDIPFNLRPRLNTSKNGNEIPASIEQELLTRFGLWTKDVEKNKSNALCHPNRTLPGERRNIQNAMIASRTQCTIPIGGATHDPQAIRNLGLLDEKVRAGANPATMCGYGEASFSADGTVKGCCSVTQQWQILDHWTSDPAELEKAIEAHRGNIDAVLERSRKEGRYPCFVCQEMQPS